MVGQQMLFIIPPAASTLPLGSNVVVPSVMGPVLPVLSNADIVPTLNFKIASPAPNSRERARQRGNLKT
jgi:hypothetical protein